MISATAVGVAALVLGVGIPANAASWKSLSGSVYSSGAFVTYATIRTAAADVTVNAKMSSWPSACTSAPSPAGVRFRLRNTADTATLGATYTYADTLVRSVVFLSGGTSFKTSAARVAACNNASLNWAGQLFY
jgi:hypothetical protein